MPKDESQTGFDLAGDKKRPARPSRTPARIPYPFVLGSRWASAGRRRGPGSRRCEEDPGRVSVLRTQGWGWVSGFVRSWGGRGAGRAWRGCGGRLLLGEEDPESLVGEGTRRSRGSQQGRQSQRRRSCSLPSVRRAGAARPRVRARVSFSSSRVRAQVRA